MNSPPKLHFYPLWLCHFFGFLVFSRINFVAKDGEQETLPSRVGCFVLLYCGVVKYKSSKLQAR